MRCSKETHFYFWFLLVALYSLGTLCTGFNLKTRTICCNLGTKHALSGDRCNTFKPPIPDIEVGDERNCLNTVDFCCKKQLREQECNSGKEDAQQRNCVPDDGDRKDCCEACRMGLEVKNAGETCTDVIGLGSPYAEAFSSCCEQNTINEAVTASTPSSIISIKTSTTTPSNIFPDDTLYPGLSEESVCETGEYCAQLCEHTGKTFKCACFEGYQLMKDGVSCKPIKQAKGRRCQANNPCDHDCLDTGTSIECSCRKGYKLDTDKKRCIDVDECALGIHECEPSEICENIEGTYYCLVETNVEEDSLKCPSGHTFIAENSTCEDINECDFDLNCSPPKTCRNTIGSFVCEDPTCPPGFQYKPSIESCNDIDECTTGEDKCDKHQVCLNTRGSYTCVDKSSRNTCPPGFKKNNLTFFCEDINECEDSIEVCNNDEQCVNEDGGYKCLKTDKKYEQSNKQSNPATKLESCPNGYIFNDSEKTCDDINECQLRLDNCSTMHHCANTIGSFTCIRIISCGTGYTINAAKDLCEDDDECALGTHTCNDLGPDYQCKNELGTYKCELKKTRPTPQTVPTTQSTTSKERIPFYPNSQTNSTKTTTSISTTQYTPIRQHYTNRPVTTSYNYYLINRLPATAYSHRFHSFNYSTPRRIFGNAQTPISAPKHPYYPQQFSIEPPQPFFTTPETNYPEQPIIKVLKKCLPGYRIDEKGDCQDINECESNPCPKGLKCLNFNGRYECSSPLQCKIGYEPSEDADRCIDVDECARQTHKCNLSQICKNGEGYYTCECPLGHHLSRITEMCQDIDECKYYRPCGSNSDCINTIGSYKCVCKPGFRREKDTCEDINECKEIPGFCQHSCVNVWGSYRCACKLGFTLNNDNRTCSDIDECQKFSDRKLCVGQCKNVPGSYVCECPPGYKLGNDKRVCIDIDECQQNICRPDEACVNTRGGYKCYPILCKPYYEKDPNHKARCTRIACNLEDTTCLRLPEQYSYQFVALVSNLPVPNEGIRLFKIKGPEWTAATADFTLKLLDVVSPPGVERVDENYIRKMIQENNLMELILVKSIQGPQQITLQVEMKLSQNRNFIGSIVIYIVIVVSEWQF